MSRRLALIELLGSYRPPEAEAPFHARMESLAASPADVLSRYHFDPGHFTASAFVTDARREALVLVHHERLGRWLQPGGHVERHDRGMLAAAVREVEEETGLGDLTVLGDVFDVDVHRIPAGKGEPPHEHHDVRFLFESAGLPVAGDGASEARWVPLDEVPILTSDRSVLRAVAKLRGL